VTTLYKVEIYININLIYSFDQNISYKTSKAMLLNSAAWAQTLRLGFIP